MHSKFYTMGVTLMARKMRKEFPGGVEIENWAQVWLNDNVDGPDEYKDLVMSAFLYILSGRDRDE